MSARKPPERRQRRDTKDSVVELVPGGLVVPAADPGWLPATVDEWSAFWADEELRSIVRASQHASLRRLFDWRDKLLRAWAEADRLREAIGADHFIEGSTGQMRANPLYDLAAKADATALAIEGRIVALEDRFGLSPQSMLKLGVDFQRRQSLAAQNERLSRGGDDSDRSAAPNDPRSLPGDSAVGSA